MIIHTGNRTHIPAFCSQWFLSSRFNCFLYKKSDNYFSAITTIFTRAPFGKAPTSTQLRAGFVIIVCYQKSFFI